MGIGYAEEMPLMLWDPYGPTPFSKLPVDEERVRISVWLEEAQIELAKKLFDTHESGAIREAIRLGFRMFYADKIKIIGPDSELYPLKQFQLKEFRNERATKALTRLLEVLEE